MTDNAPQDIRRTTRAAESDDRMGSSGGHDAGKPAPGAAAARPLAPGKAAGAAAATTVSGKPARHGKTGTTAPSIRQAERLNGPLLRFLRALPPAGAQLCSPAMPPAGVCAPTLELETATARLRVEAATVLLAARQGLIARDGTRIRPLPEASAFIARHATPEPDFARPHRDLEETSASVDGETARVTRNLSESPLSALERLKGRAGETYFPREALAAGERLHADFTRGQLQPQITMRFEPRLGTSVKGGRGAVADLSDTAIAARLRVNRALADIGPELAGVALDICCFMKGLETVERERQWPPRSAKLMLKTALMALHRHYTPPTRRETRHWGEEGYRPEM